MTQEPQDQNGSSDLPLCVYAEQARGPGWSNDLYWCTMYRDDGGLYTTAVQPFEQTELMFKLHSLSAEINRMLLLEMQKVLKNRIRVGEAED